MIMGSFFGFIFGFTDAEDTPAYLAKLTLFKEEHYCYPIGLSLGLCTGYINQYLKERVISTSIFSQQIGW
jgi:hypothetical protein